MTSGCRCGAENSVPEPPGLAAIWRDTGLLCNMLTQLRQNEFPACRGRETMFRMPDVRPSGRKITFASMRPHFSEAIMLDNNGLQDRAARLSESAVYMCRQPVVVSPARRSARGRISASSADGQLALARAQPHSAHVGTGDAVGHAGRAAGEVEAAPGAVLAVLISRDQPGQCGLWQTRVALQRRPAGKDDRGCVGHGRHHGGSAMQTQPVAVSLTGRKTGWRGNPSPLRAACAAAWRASIGRCSRVREDHVHVPGAAFPGGYIPIKQRLEDECGAASRGRGAQVQEICGGFPPALPRAAPHFHRRRL